MSKHHGYELYAADYRRELAGIAAKQAEIDRLKVKLKTSLHHKHVLLLVACGFVLGCIASALLLVAFHG
jgi:hypothetical protein